MARPFRFGVQASAPLPGRSWAETAQHVESLGYSSLLLPDHFGDQLAPVPAMMAAAAATTTLRVGALVFDNDYKHPVVLAKEMATIDVLSGGRVEFGLGAGWMRTDYESSGIPYDPPGVRVDRFEEAIAVCKGIFSGEPFDFDGTHYQIRGLEGRPRPTRPGGPPLLIGGGGRRMLRIAGREADIVSVNPNMAAGEVTASTALDALAPSIDEKIGWLREGAGDRFEDLELSITLFFCQITDDGATAAEMVGLMFGVGAAEVRDCPILAIGTTDEIADVLVARRERWGFSYLLCQLEAAESLAPVVAQLAGR